MADLLDLDAWRAYDAPDIDVVTEAKCRAWQINPGDREHTRLIARQSLPVPVTLVAVFTWQDDLEPDGVEWLGLHFGLGQDEDHNFMFSLRHNGVMAWQQEDHSRGADGNYDSLIEDSHGARPDGQRHQLRLTFNYHSLSADLNGHQGGQLAAAVNAKTRFPNLLCGRPMIRLDRQQVRIHDLAVG